MWLVKAGDGWEWIQMVVGKPAKRLPIELLEPLWLVSYPRPPNCTELGIRGCIWYDQWWFVVTQNEYIDGWELIKGSPWTPAQWMRTMVDTDLQCCARPKLEEYPQLQCMNVQFPSFPVALPLPRPMSSTWLGLASSPRSQEPIRRFGLSSHTQSINCSRFTFRSQTWSRSAWMLSTLLVYKGVWCLKPQLTKDIYKVSILESMNLVG